jgi:hypothetical protein
LAAPPFHLVIMLRSGRLQLTLGCKRVRIATTSKGLNVFLRFFDDVNHVVLHASGLEVVVSAQHAIVCLNPLRTVPKGHFGALSTF